MDYLDPKKKRAHKIRLLIGYALFGVVIGISTIVLVYLVNGYYIDRSTGEVIQNGLVFLDSRPQGANIYLNGERQGGGTDARLVLPAASYDIRLEREGYRSWSRSLQLEGGSLRRLTYPRLIPNELDSLSTTTLPDQPDFGSQSIDKRWLLLSYTDNTQELTLLDLEQSAVVPQSLVLPDNLVEPVEGAMYRVVDWADDNTTVLLAYGTEDSRLQYVLLDRTNPDEAENLTITFGSRDYEINFRDRKKDQFFVFNTQNDQLYTATLSDGVAESPFIDTELVDYKVFGTDWMVYIVDHATDERLQELRLKRAGEDILLNTIPSGSPHLLELAKYGNVPVVGTVSVDEGLMTVYFDPEKYLAENPSASQPVADTILRVEQPEALTISSDASVVMTYNLQGDVASYEVEAEQSSVFSLDIPIDDQQEARWMDGQHFSFTSDGTQHLVDFNGSNLNKLIPSIPRLGSFYSDDAELMFSFAPATAKTEETSATSPRMRITSLRTAEDR